MKQSAFALAAVVGVICGVAHAQPALDTSGATQCTNWGYNTDRDPKGTNIRAAPRATAPVFGKLPAFGKIDGSDEDVGAEFSIVGSKDGWLLIEYKSDAGDKLVRGWLSGRRVGGTIGSLTLHVKPSGDSAVVANLSGKTQDSNYGPDSVEIMQVHGCQGSFTDVTVRVPKAIKPLPGQDKPMRGWVGRVCSNQLTTCG